MSASITGLYGSILVFHMLVLAYRVVLSRRRNRVGLGDGANEELQKAIRIHGNACEYLPPSLILMLILELGGGPAWALHFAGITLIAGRLLHWYGISGTTGRSFGRYWGTSITWLTLAWLAVANITLFVRSIS